MFSGHRPAIVSVARHLMQHGVLDLPQKQTRLLRLCRLQPSWRSGQNSPLVMTKICVRSRQNVLAVGMICRHPNTRSWIQPISSSGSPRSSLTTRKPSIQPRRKSPTIPSCPDDAIGWASSRLRLQSGVGRARGIAGHRWAATSRRRTGSSRVWSLSGRWRYHRRVEC